MKKFLYFKTKWVKAPFICAVGLLIILSCAKTLDLAPTSALSDETFWASSTDFKLATNEFYFRLPGQGFYDNNSDITWENSPNSVSSGTNTLPPNDGIWNATYRNLLWINKVLLEASNYEGGDDISRWVGEAKFFRAWNYFNLVLRFGDVPYFDTPIDPTDTEALQQPRESREVVINNVIQDLKEAAPDLPLQNGITGNDLGRISRGAAQALLARVALYEATWAKYHQTPGNAQGLLGESITAAEAIIASGEYSLFVYDSDPTLSYFNSYMLPGNDSKEQILARRYDPEVGGHAHGHWLCCGGRGDGTKKLADLYVATDGLPIDVSPLFQGYDSHTSEWENRDLRMSNTLMKPGINQVNRQNQDGSRPWYPNIAGNEETGYRVNKLVSNDPDGFVWGRNHEFKHILKYSEVLLNLAEALYERDGSISDTDLDRTINLLRARGGVAPLTNSLVSSNGLNLLEEIRRERTVELAYDGFRLNDLKRWKIAVEELGDAVRGVQIGNGAWDNVKDGDWDFSGIKTVRDTDSEGFILVQDAGNRLFSEKNYLFPIPSQQIQLSENTLTQNPGW